MHPTPWPRESSGRPADPPGRHPLWPGPGRRGRLHRPGPARDAKEAEPGNVRCPELSRWVLLREPLDFRVGSAEPESYFVTVQPEYRVPPDLVELLQQPVAREGRQVLAAQFEQLLPAFLKRWRIHKLSDVPVCENGIAD